MLKTTIIGGIKMNASVAIQVLPKAEEDKKIVEIVDKVIDYIESTGLPYYVGPFETTIEGDLDELMDIVKKCQYIVTDGGAPSVLSYVKIHFNPKGGVLSIDEKVTKHHK